MNNQQSSQDFRKLIEKYLDGKINGEEIERLVNYYESFQKSHEWVEELGSENMIKDKMLANILDSIKDERATIKVVPFHTKPIFKYAIAASVALLISLNFIFHSTEEHQIAPLVVDAKTISIGTDKATLTLADGTLVDLESGESYKTSHVNSNGKEIIYETEETNAPEVAYNYLTIPRGGQFFVKLSDGTQVWLNSESQLKYPVNFISGKTREVELVYGEAYFKVSPSTAHKGAKFKVSNQNQEVEVFGTEFNLKSYREDTHIYTTLVEGMITVNLEEKKRLVKPNQQSVLDVNNQSITVSNVDVYNEVSWKEGVFSFEDLTLKEITKVLSRWYDVDFVFLNTSLENEKFVGVLDKNQDLEDILSTIKNFGKLGEYRIKDKKIMLE